ncbi:hypothetical protein ACTMU2_36280 [Cupriavidus basilensis]
MMARDVVRGTRGAGASDAHRAGAWRWSTSTGWSPVAGFEAYATRSPARRHGGHLLAPGRRRPSAAPAPSCARPGADLPGGTGRSPGLHRGWIEVLLRDYYDPDVRVYRQRSRAARIVLPRRPRRGDGLAAAGRWHLVR